MNCRNDQSCTHPNHIDDGITTCEDRSIGCRPNCACCMIPKKLSPAACILLCALDDAPGGELPWIDERVYWYVLGELQAHTPKLVAMIQSDSDIVVRITKEGRALVTAMTVS